MIKNHISSRQFEPLLYIDLCNNGNFLSNKNYNSSLEFSGKMFVINLKKNEFKLS